MRRRIARDISGIVLLDKPLGITSNAALQIVKRLFQAAKAGHTGSLDPLATGMLPICLGEATKISAFLLEADKRYRVLIKLGITTTTGDAEGKVVETRPVTPFKQVILDEVLKSFIGEIRQIPPMHSAIKRNGRPLYELAHQGIEVEREERIVTIHDIRFLAYADDLLEVEVTCSKGTYIRTLAEDIGRRLGTGGHVARLRRLDAGPFKEGQMLAMDTLESLAQQGLAHLDAVILPMEYALAEWPDVCLTEDLTYFLKQGQAVFVPRAPTRGWVRLRSPDQRFLGVGCVLDDGRVAPKRLVNA